MSLSDLSFNWDLRWNMPCFVSWFDEDWSFPIVSPWYILIVSYVSYICHFLCITIYNIPILLIYWLYTVYIYIYPHSKSPLKYECWHPHADWRGLPFPPWILLVKYISAPVGISYQKLGSHWTILSNKTYRNHQQKDARTAEQQFYISLPWDVKIDSCIEMAKDTLW